MEERYKLIKGETKMKLETLKQAMAQYEDVKATFDANKDKPFDELYEIFCRVS